MRVRALPQDAILLDGSGRDARGLDGTGRSRWAARSGTARLYGRCPRPSFSFCSSLARVPCRANANRLMPEFLRLCASIKFDYLCSGAAAGRGGGCGRLGSARVPAHEKRVRDLPRGLTCFLWKTSVRFGRRADQRPFEKRTSLRPAFSNRYFPIRLDSAIRFE